VRPAGSTNFGTRCEIKNLNSLRSLGRAIDYEAARQIDVVERGWEVLQETRHWDETSGRTGSMRSKEEAYDYRYFPEPDLVPVDPPSEWIAEVAASLPDLPAARRAEVAAATGLGPDADPVVTVVRLDLDPYVGAVVAGGGDAALAVRRLANEVAAEIDSIPRLTVPAFVDLVAMESGGSLTTAQARSVLKELLDSGGEPAEVAARLGYEAMPAGDLSAVVDQVVADHPSEWGRYAAGEDKLSGFFIGHIKAATSGKADLKAAAALLRSRRG
jgi:aspartyl-tRNA(Asn)/glutamyl-tRNA(Gln) amidotransferase subunit B